MQLSDINSFGLGIGGNGVDDLPFFWGSDFWMPAKWTVPPHRGSKPNFAGTSIRTGESRFLIFGEDPAVDPTGMTALIVASVTFIDVSTRKHRWEHRPQEDGRRYNYGTGLVIDVDPQTWQRESIPVSVEMSTFSYRYGHLADGVFTPIIKSALRAA